MTTLPLRNSISRTSWRCGFLFAIAVALAATFAVSEPASGAGGVSYDFNGDGHPDYLLYNVSTRQTAIWYMNNNVRIGAAYGPPLPTGWNVIDVADFNKDGHPDYLLGNASTLQTAIWYMNNNVRIGAVYGATLPSGWQLVTTADFNGDGHPDYILYNPVTLQTAIWYMNNNVRIGAAYGPAIVSGYTLSEVADFNGDGHPDYVLDPSGLTAIWYMNGPVRIGAAYGPTLPAGWKVALALGSTNFCSYSISPLGASFTSQGGAGFFNVKANAGCTWEAVAQDPFIHITSYPVQTGPGYVNYTVDPFPCPDQRSGSIDLDVAELKFNIAQSGTGGTWDGTWVGTVTGSFCGSSGCCYTGTASFTMTIKTTGTAVTGSADELNLPCFNTADCSIYDFEDTFGTVSGAVSCATINIKYSGSNSTGIFCSGQSVSVSFTGTLSGNTITGTSSNGSETFKLTKQ